MTDTDVLVVGGGPVGLGLAIELGQRGVRVLLAERHLQPSPIPRGQNLTQRTLEHFHAWRCEAELRAARLIPPEFGSGGMTAYGTLLSDHHYDWMPRALVRPFYFTDNERLPQYATETVLRRRLAALPTVQARFGCTFRGLSQEADSVTATIAPDDGEPRTVRARYLVGCDGSRSAVREGAGITQTRQDHDRLMVLLVFRSPELHALLARYKGKSFFSVLHPEDDGYWRFFGRVDLEARFFFHAQVPPGTTRDNYDFAALLARAVGMPFAADITHVGFWDLRIATADRYDQGRVFIAGDAAHSHPPYGGYGINTGFEDARNLGWKLAASLAGWGGPGLLPSYGEERRPVFLSTAADFIARAIETDRAFLRRFHPDRDRAAFDAAWAARGAGAPAEVDAFEPHYEGSSLTSGPAGTPSASGHHDHAARPGHHLGPARLSDGRPLHEALGPDYTLLAFGLDPAPFADAARSLAIPLAVVNDTFEGDRARYRAPFILVRPDGYVAWCGDRGDPSAILARAVGRSS